MRICAIVIMLMIVFNPAYVALGKNKPNLDSIMETARNYAKEKGINSNVCRVVIYRNVTPYQMTDSKYSETTTAKLSGKEFWAIEFYRTGPVNQGGIVVFIDADTGEVLETLRLH